MKHVLQVLPCLELGGTEAFVMNHYRTIDRGECQFDFMVFVEKAYPYLDEIRSLGGQVFFSGAPSVKNLPGFLKNARRIMTENGPYDAIHCHAGIASGWALLAARQCGIPVRVSHSHGTDSMAGAGLSAPYRRLQAMLNRACATHLLACGKAAGRDLFGERCFARRGEVIFNSIPVERFQSVCPEAVAALRQEFRIPEDCGLVLGNITRFDANKNPLFTLDVFSHVLKKRPDAVLLLGGPDAGLLETTKQQAEALGISAHIRFIGPRNDIPVCLQLINVYVFPSLFEGLGIALLEAQAAGCVCVASDNVPPEADMGLGSVWFRSLKDPAEAWAEEIEAKSAEIKSPDGTAVKTAFVKKGYDLDNTAQTLLAIYAGNIA